jgi:hypothetical protein
VAVHSAWPVLCKRTLVPRVTRASARSLSSPFAQNNTTSGPAGARPWPGKTDKGSARDSVDVRVPSRWIATSGKVQRQFTRTYLLCAPCRANCSHFTRIDWLLGVALPCFCVHIGQALCVHLSVGGRARVGVKSKHSVKYSTVV